MKPLVSILLPHLREPNNDAALKIALDCIVAHTDINYELVMESVEERRDIYAVVNRMAEHANSEWIIPTNTDVFVGPNWIRPLYDARDDNTIVAGVMVECGAIGVSHLNHHKNFGMTPQTFDRAAFEQWVVNERPMPDGDRAWYFPSLIPRGTFLAMGGFDLTRGAFPDPLDEHFWDKWQAAGKKFKRVRSWMYHLQQWSFEHEQTKRVRHT